MAKEMEYLDFSEEEIQLQLEALGYSNIPKHRLREFKRDLDELIRHEKSKSLVSSSEMSSPRSQSCIQKDVPAYSKCIVQQNNDAILSSRSSSQVGAPNDGRQVLTSTYSIDNSNSGWRKEHYDSYTQHSVATKYHCPSAAPNRMQMEGDVIDIQSPSFTISQTTTPERDTGAHGRSFLKRKVLRKIKGEVRVCDESTHSEDSGAVSGLEGRLGGLHVSPSTNQDSELERGDTDSLSDRHSSEPDAFPSAFEAYIKGMARSRSENDVRPRPKSFIRPLLDHPHTRHLKKTDPVARYLRYKQEWEIFKLPGEKERKELHWKIREQLSYQPPPAKPRRVFVPNSYVVPTEKKRSALRWEVRHDLANGLLPPRINYRL